MAYRDLNEGFVSTQSVSSPKKTYLPNFPSDTRLVTYFPQLNLLHRNFGKFHTMQWVDFVLDNPDEIWERIIDEDNTYYYYFYFLGSDVAVPVFVVELYFDDDEWVINNHTIVIDAEAISRICKFTRVYSRAKEWEKESFIKRLNDKALEKYDSNELTDARRLIDAAIDLSGAESAYLLNNRGLICWKMGKIDQAKTDFLASINLDTDNGDPYFNLGLIYFDESSFSKALYYLEKAVDIDPTDSQFLTELAHLYLELDKESQALALFKKAFENNPTDAQIDFHLGYYFLYKKRNPRSALKYYKKGLQKDPGDQFAIADSAIAHWVTGNAKKTAQLRKMLQEQKFLMPYTISRLVYLNMEMGNYEIALHYYREALNHGEPFEPEWLHYNAAIVYAKTGNRKLALDKLNLAIRAGGEPVIRKALCEKALESIKRMSDFKKLTKLQMKRKT